MERAAKNRFGLSRSIPSGIRRDVRIRCGFGCVVCANAIYDYEHFAPEFKDARSHEPEGIALLCPNCHRKKKRGLLSEEEYTACIQSPLALTRGFAFTDWSLGSFAPQILLGVFTFTGGTSILRIGGELLLGFEPPEEPGSPPNLLFRVRDRRGVESFSIVENEIRCNNNAFDIEAVGDSWTVRSAKYKVDLVVRFYPPTLIDIERLRFRHLRWELMAEARTLALRFDGEPAGANMSGPAKIDGPCLFDLPTDAPTVSLRNLKISFGSGPKPIGTQPVEGGFVVTWPVYCPVDPATGELLIISHRQGRLLGLYTQKRLAQAACQACSKIATLSANQAATYVEEYGNRALIDSVAFNPTRRFAASVFSWEEFLERLQAARLNVAQLLDANDPLLATVDTRPVAISFPVYLIVRTAPPETPIHEMDFPVAIPSFQVDLIPVFTKRENAEAILPAFDRSRVLEIGKAGFVHLLRHVFLRRRIEHLIFNPDATIEAGATLGTTLVVDVIAGLESGMTAAQIEHLVDDGTFRLL